MKFVFMFLRFGWVVFVRIGSRSLGRLRARVSMEAE